VVAGGKAPPSWLIPAKAIAIRQANQKLFLSLSPNSWQGIAARSGHAPQISEPAIVVQAIQDVLKVAARPLSGAG
jgi:hypothetical protein